MPTYVINDDYDVTTSFPHREERPDGTTEYVPAVVWRVTGGQLQAIQTFKSYLPDAIQAERAARDEATDWIREGGPNSLGLSHPDNREVTRRRKL